MMCLNFSDIVSQVTYGDAGQKCSPGINPSRTTLTLTLDATLLLILDAWPFDRARSNVLSYYSEYYSRGI